MTERSDPHAADAMVGPHGKPADHGADHGNDDHGHASEADALGPVDAASWGAAALGIALGLAVAIVFLVASGFRIGGS